MACATVCSHNHSALTLLPRLPRLFLLKVKSKSHHLVTLLEIQHTPQIQTSSAGQSETSRKQSKCRKGPEVHEEAVLKGSAEKSLSDKVSASCGWSHGPFDDSFYLKMLPAISILSQLDILCVCLHVVCFRRYLLHLPKLRRGLGHSSLPLEMQNSSFSPACQLSQLWLFSCFIRSNHASVREKAGAVSPVCSPKQGRPPETGYTPGVPQHPHTVQRDGSVGEGLSHRD